jgi:hypothetical protein
VLSASVMSVDGGKDSFGFSAREVSGFLGFFLLIVDY